MVARNRTLLLPVLAGALLLGACEASTGSLEPNDARLSIQLTDAPGDLKEARVKLSKVVLQGRETGDSTSGRQDFAVPSGEWIDLLALSGGKLKDLVSGAAVRPGTYTQLRLVVDEAYVVTRDDRVFATSGAQLPSGVAAATGELVCPGCRQSGFKVKFPGGIEVDDATTLVIDFDVNQSFGHEAGKSGKFVLKPVLIGTRRGGGTPALGKVGGTVTLAQGVTIPACGGVAAPDLTRFVPTATAGDTKRTGTTQANGAYVIGALAAGSYTMGVDRVGFANGDTLSFTAAATPATAAVTAGSQASAGYSVTAAACRAAG